MSLGTILYLVGMALIYVAERLLDGFDVVRWVVLFAGASGIAGGALLHFRHFTTADDDGTKAGYRRTLVAMSTGVFALLLYVLSTSWFVGVFGMSDSAAHRWTGVFTALWPLVWTIGTIPLLVVDNALQRSPVLIPITQVKQVTANALVAALGLGLVFPINYIANDHDVRWDFSFLKTAEPGSATKSVLASLEEPVDVRLFFGPSSEVLQELKLYFEPLEGENLRIHVVDQAADPALAKKLRVRDNGYIAVTQGDISEEKRPEVQRVRIGAELKDARPKLKKLDEEFHKALLAVARGQMVAYLTSGHREFDFKSSRSRSQRLESMKQLLEMMNFKVKRLGLTEGLGEAVPEDADLVMVIGPEQAFLPEELETLKDYLDRGGSLLVALEPDISNIRPGLAGRSPTMEELLDRLGLKLGEGVLAQERKIVPMANNKADRMNLVTDRFSSHPSTANLSKRSSVLKLLVPTAGYLLRQKTDDAKVTVTVRSLSQAWADKNADLEYDSGKEVKKSYDIAAVSTGEAEGGEAFRALVVADATAFTDLAIANPGNQQFVYDGLNWLAGIEGASGSIESEEDVRIQHTREGQAVWFYATVLGVPILLLVFGLVRVRLRTQGGEA